MKISTNSTLAKNKPGWIDFNAGVIVENEPMEKTCERFIDYIIKVANGEFVNNEKKGVPRPVVKSTMWHPLAARVLAATRSLPGAESRFRPFFCKRSP